MRHPALSYRDLLDLGMSYEIHMAVSQAPLEAVTKFVRPQDEYQTKPSEPQPDLRSLSVDGTEQAMRPAKFAALRYHFT